MQSAPLERRENAERTTFLRLNINTRQDSDDDGGEKIMLKAGLSRLSTVRLYSGQCAPTLPSGRLTQSNWTASGDVGSKRWMSTDSVQSGQRSRVAQLNRPATPPGVESFVSHANRADAEPLLLPGLVKDQYPWPALKEWSHVDANGVETLAGMRNQYTADAIVDVEIGQKGRGYMDKAGWQKIQMPFDAFLDAFIAQTLPSTTEATRNLVGYVAQQDLLSQIPTWSAQLQPPLPHIKQLANSQYWRRNYWIGPRDTFTPIHRDPYHNLFVQVVGSKRVHIFPPSVSDHLYISQDSVQKNTSLVPSEDFLLDHGGRGEYPGLEKAIHHPQSRSVVLRPGDGLYIPRGWFHCVRSLSTSVSVNDWWTVKI